jgi:hypothetical protein
MTKTERDLRFDAPLYTVGEAATPRSSSYDINSPSCPVRCRDRASNQQTAPSSPRSLGCSLATAGRSSW